jgi:hypothetical protein
MMKTLIVKEMLKCILFKTKELDLYQIINK